ncbi:uncharacterized protein LOC116934059 [Daphnia magna]|uniref:uncharacterized protein LOC116934059 n=1 Tax=Daphnia magna TaxID=35525 RepID=UPI001E1BDEF5|nr:uncharacterized protein LOC116934059 [Daphnia magna]
MAVIALPWRVIETLDKRQMEITMKPPVGHGKGRKHAKQTAENNTEPSRLPQGDPAPNRTTIHRGGITIGDYDGYHTYLPHHPVYRKDKSTTKIRPVFDGAATSKHGPSLNDVLETEPNLNPDLLSVLMRFRTNRIAWVADIEKEFLNIVLQPED